MSELATKSIPLDSREEAVILLGPRDQYLRLIRDTLGVKLFSRGDTLSVEGTPEAIEQTERIFQQLRVIYRKTGKLSLEDVKSAIEAVTTGGGVIGQAAPGDALVSKFLRPRTDGQSRYVQAMKSHDVVLCVGPAGTGKTFLAVGWAVTLLRSRAVKKIVLVRPAVEAGERLGFLPGDLVAKINPYLRPLFDSLNDMMDPDQVRRYMESDIIEIVPLAYMRGRTLNDACIILDEGQNATSAQMKMFLTRMGNNSKVIVTGDMTQVDLPKTMKSGLADAVLRLRDIDGIAVIHLDEADIVRNPIVQRIVHAYEDETPRRRA
jgi:phosphate starvation-inducible protein PhoH and related proteins